jgi:NDP-sugar pyrophosphorylase family protein
MTHALLLCAGLGTRLRPLTLVRSKPAIPVAGEPMARRILRWLAASGVTDVVINLHHLPESLTAVIGDGSDLGVQVRYSWEQPAVLGSAGGPRLALDIVGVPTFAIVNGDTLTDVSIASVARAHAQSGALVTLALTPNTQPDRYGGVLLADDGAVTGVVPPRSPVPSYHFIGVQIAHRDAFRDLPVGQFANSIGDVYDRLIAARPGSVRGYVCDASFWDVGTVADYWATSHAFDRVAPAAAAASAVPASARLTDVIVWDNVTIGERAVLERCIVTDGVHVADDAVHRNAILMRGDGGATVAVPLPETQ